MRVMLRAITVNSRLASDAGRKAGMVTMLMAKWPPQCQPQCTEESTVVVGFTYQCWGEPGCIRVLCSCPLPLAVAGAAERFTTSGNCQTIGQRCVCSSPHIASDSLLWLVCPGEARRDDTLLKSSLCTEVLRPTAACCWVSQL